MSDNPFAHDKPVQKNAFLDLMQTVVLALAFSLVIYLVFLVPSQVDGPSMEPNFCNNELLFANRIIQWMGATPLGQKWDYDYKQGDVVICKLPEENLIKGGVGVAGDTVRIEDGSVYVNDQKLDEPYLPEGRISTINVGRPTLNEGETVVVPEGKYFLMGDNRPVSKDSRSGDIGFVDREQLRGKVFLRYFPFNRFDTIGRAKKTGDEC